MPSFFYHIVIELENSTPTRTLLNDTFPLITTDVLGRPPQLKYQQLTAGDSSETRELQHSISSPNRHLAHGRKTVSNIACKNIPNTNNTQSNHIPDNGSLPSQANDWRFGNISIQSTDMQATKKSVKNQKILQTEIHVSHGIEGGPNGLATKGRYEPTDLDGEGLGWGVVRLYRDAEETSTLYDNDAPNQHSRHSRDGTKRGSMFAEAPFRDEDCTTLCILAVPSYLSPSDFLGFVGENTREQVSHFRMIRTERVNRYMVLMKFRSGKKAREWRQQWNGKAFNTMEPENCHVVFIKSIEFRTLPTAGQESFFPDMMDDTSTSSTTTAATATNSSTTTISKIQPSSTQSAMLNTKPIAPPTPSLVELPTCPVCLERMDESTGLLTILCQHVFHCSCLQKWKGSGCPVCRYTQDEFVKRNLDTENDTGLNECSICRSDSNLWICLICGNVGCGRYDAAHAFLHYQHSSHCFAMDLTTQRVWDYATDAYVHRIIQNKTDGKLVELPSANPDLISTVDGVFDDFIPHEKVDSIGLEYTHLLTSQLDSQRMYFEEKVERAADKASQATLAATQANESASKALAQFTDLQSTHNTLLNETLPALTRETERSARKAEKFEAMVRKMEKEWQDEKAMNKSLMERIAFMGVEKERAEAEKAELEEQVRDLSAFISGGERLKGLGEEVVEGTVSLPESERGGGKKGEKGKGRKGKG